VVACATAEYVSWSVREDLFGTDSAKRIVGAFLMLQVMIKSLKIIAGGEAIAIASKDNPNTKKKKWSPITYITNHFRSSTL